MTCVSFDLPSKEGLFKEGLFQSKHGSFGLQLAIELASNLVKKKNLAAVKMGHVLLFFLVNAFKKTPTLRFYQHLSHRST